MHWARALDTPMRSIALIAGLVASMTACGCSQDPTCSEAGKARLNVAVSEVLQATSGRVIYISTPDCEDGDPLTATLELRKPHDLARNLAEDCEGDIIALECRFDGAKFQIFASGGSLHEATQIQIGEVVEN